MINLHVQERAIDRSSSIMWNWKTQYCLTVKTDPPGTATIGGDDWYDASASAVLTAPTLGSGGYRFLSWDVDSTSKGAANLISVKMNAPIPRRPITAYQLVESGFQ